MTLAFNVSELLKSPVGATRRVTIDEPGPRFGRELHLLEPVRGAARLLRTQNGVLVNAHLETSVELECSRCLEPVHRRVAVDVIEEFRPLVNVTTGAPLEPPDDDALRIDERHLLDLTEATRQYIETEIPLQPLCQEGCHGLCPRCGANLNREECACALDAVDPSNPFAALAGLMEDTGPESRAG